jgi:hypothetical protein
LRLDEKVISKKIDFTINFNMKLKKQVKVSAGQNKKTPAS